MNSKLRETLHRWRIYWTATGVIPRYQLILVYSLITAVFVIASVRSFAAAHEAGKAVRAVQAQRVESIRTSCEGQNGRHYGVVGAINQQIIIAITQEPSNHALFERATHHARLRDLAKQAKSIKDPGVEHERLAKMAAEAKRYLALRDQQQFDRSFAQTFALLNAGAPLQDCAKLLHRVAPPVNVGR